MLKKTLGLLIVPVLFGLTLLIASPAYAADLDCGDFQYQEDAQEELNKTLPADPHRLDGNDNDGVACEGNPKRPASDTDETDTSRGVTPSEESTLPETGFDPVWMVLIGVALLGGGGALAFAFRKS